MERLHAIARRAVTGANVLWLPPALALLQAPLRAADAVPVPAAAVRIAATPARSVIVIDGLLTEPAWSVPAATDFVQRDPYEGVAPSESTEVRVLYDTQALYVGVRMFDRNAGQIGRRLSRRDDEPDADVVQVYLDPRRDGRSGAMFEVSAAGAQRDALIYNDASLDYSWDAVWDSAVSIDERSWTAELRIPLSQLRAASSDAWGINVARYIRRRNETDWLVLVPKRETHLAGRMAELTGLDGVRATPRMEIASHAVARDMTSSGASTAAGSGIVNDLSVDVKAGVGRNLAVDATVNPDFAQVEADPAAVNLTAFETFREERRPFFTESVPLFQTYGNPGGAFDAATPLLFYSRRIGQAPPESVIVAPLSQPTATPVLGALKLSGAVGRAWKIGIVDAVTGATSSPSALGPASPAVRTAPLANYAAGRLFRTGDRGGVGTLATAVVRDASDPIASGTFVPTRALVGGADAYAFLDDYQEWVAGGQVSASHLSWTPVFPSAPPAPANASAAVAHVAAANVIGFIDQLIVHSGPPPTPPGHGPPGTPPGHGPPGTPPGHGLPPTPPGGGPPSTTPGGGPPVSAPGRTPPVGGPTVDPHPVGGGNGGVGTDNTGTNRVVDVAAGQLDGWSVNGNVHRNGGALRVNLDTWAVSPGFETNDLGYLPRADIQGLRAQASWNKFDADGVTRYRSLGAAKGWTRTFAGERQSDTVDVWASATFLNYWSASGGVAMWRQAFDATATRGGPSVWTPPGRNWWMSGSTDSRAAISVDGGVVHGGNESGDQSDSAWATATLKPSSSVTVSIGPTIEHTNASAQYVATVAAAGAESSVARHYVFASVAASDVTLVARVNVMATARLSFQLYVQPFVASGEYTGFKELARPASNQFVRYGIDAGTIRLDAPAGQYVIDLDPATSLRFADPTFNSASLDVHAVARWEWRRGSTVYLVWTQRRSGAAAAGPAGVTGLSRSLDAPADNAFAAKFTYWFGR